VDDGSGRLGKSLNCRNILYEIGGYPSADSVGGLKFEPDLVKSAAPRQRPIDTASALLAVPAFPAGHGAVL